MKFRLEKNMKFGNSEPFIMTKNLSHILFTGFSDIGFVVWLLTRSSACKARDEVFAKRQAAIPLGAFKLSSC